MSSVLSRAPLSSLVEPRFTAGSIRAVGWGLKFRLLVSVAAT
jgi:hypothetical protein